jgi:Tol biopolymer transport system component
MRADGTARKTITPKGRDDEDPAWSADGTRVAFDTPGPRGQEVAVLDLRTRHLRRIGGGSSPDWSPDGRRLVAVDSRNYDDLVIMDADGSHRKKLQLTRAGIADETRPAWSPDGRRIAFVGNGLYVVAQNGTGLRRIRREGTGGGASWSPNGRRIAFDCFARRFETCMVGADGSGLRGLSRTGRHPKWSSRNLVATTLEEPADGVLVVRPDGRLVRHLRGALSSPGWSPDGRRLVIAYEVATNIRLYATDPAGNRSDRLTAPHGAVDRAPVWSPDGARIVFRRHRPGRCLLAVLDPRTRRTRVLVGRTKDRYCDDRPDWGRGRGILYESGGDLWVVSPRGGRPRRITNTSVAETSPRFAPHGEIGFLASGGIWVRRADGSRSLLVPNGGRFAWSHNGRSLAYAVYNSNAEQDDLYLKVGSDPPRKLFAGIDGTPSWSPDDRQLVFSHTDPYPGEATSLLVTDLSGSARSIWGDPLGDPDWRPR